MRELPTSPVLQPKEIKPSLWNQKVVGKLKYLSEAYMSLMTKTGVKKLITRINKVVKLEELRRIEEDVSR
jgi:hypothetical protein